MQHDEIHDIGVIAGDALGGGVRLVADVHRAIADRVFGRVGEPGRPVRFAHDGITAIVYGTVRSVYRAVPQLAATVVSMTVSPSGSVHDSARGALVLASINGLWGDHIAARSPALAVATSIRWRGAVVEPEPAEVSSIVTEPTPRLAVFVHGLGGTDQAWTRAPRDGASFQGSYGERFERDLGYTPLFLRYNTGLHVSENGRELARLLERVVEAWPVAVEEVLLIGHSMGGLVARSACHYGDLDGATWPSLVGHVICLGTPHLGAPLEKAANAAGWALGRWPESAPFARLLTVRSAGIKDLRFGAVVDDDWRGHDPDEFLRDRCREVPFLPGAHYYFIGATIGRGPDGFAGWILGDLLVRLPSASGVGSHRRIPFEIDHGHHVIGLNHFELLNHHAVYDQLHHWLEPEVRSAGRRTDTRRIAPTGSVLGRGRPRRDPR